MNNCHTRMYLLEFNPNIGQSSVEQQGLPLHMLNLNNENYLVPVFKTNSEHSGQVEILIDTTSDDNLLSYTDKSTPNQIPYNKLSGTKHKATTQKICTQLNNQINESIRDYNGITELKLEHPTFDYNIVTKETENGPQEEKKKIIQNYVHIPDRLVPPRAEAVLPDALQLRRDASVLVRRGLPAPARFGPVTGISHILSEEVTRELISRAAELKVPIFLINNKGITTHIDVSDKDKSNWLSLLPLGDQSKANVWLYQEDNELYAVTTVPLEARSILYLGYSKEYAELHNLPPNQAIIDLNEALSKEPKKWWCYECHSAQASAVQMRQHNEVCTKKNCRPRLKRYRCQHCTRTFSRLFTLRRHVKSNCRKKSNKSDIPMQSETLPDTGANTTLSVEDNRIPSDESFQNYTNGLDFSTNLFDTDRMPNLDISGSSRSEVDFNTYSIEYKVDISSNNELELSKTTNDFMSKSQQNIDNEKSLLSSCPYCNTVMAKEMKSQHVRQCPARRFECECGTVFFNKEKLENHIFSDHPIDAIKEDHQKLENDRNTNETPFNCDQCRHENDSDEMPYKCEQCQHSFKRRGMLVNHLFRAHRVGAAAAAAALPLARHERCYPCGTCPKLYRSRAKRDRHVRAHHPGIELDPVQTIIGGKKAYEPAACMACPRQYATRAKLLQHIRAHHPHLAPPKKRSLKETKRVLEVC